MNIVIAVSKTICHMRTNVQKTSIISVCINKEVPWFMIILQDASYNQRNQKKSVISLSSLTYQKLIVTRHETYR